MRFKQKCSLTAFPVMVVERFYESVDRDGKAVDRTIIDIKPEYVDAWLNPAGDLKKMQAIFDDRQHPYYEHREAV